MTCVKLQIFWLSVMCIVLTVNCTCPHGKIEKGVNAKNKKTIVNKHNCVRTMLLQGKLPGQPKPKSMPKLKWDSKLASAAQKIADTCVYGHVPVNDDRMTVGQNIYLFESTEKKRGSDWNSAIQAWSDEYKIFKYPTVTHETGHYTQIVWEDTKYVGCGYAFYEKDEKLPYQKYYVCNYGPAGNIIGEDPYEIE